MSAVLFALALLMQDAPAPDVAPDAATAPAPAQEEAPWPTGAPRDDYQFVAWCYGALGGYLDLHDTVMPEVKRIETTFRRPGSNLAEDLKVYADMQTEGRRNMRVFTRALTAAEKASMRPINTQGAEAIRRGRAVWAGSATAPKARVAQEWMSWALPARCEPTAQALEKRSLLAAASLQANAQAAPEPAPEPAQTQDAPAQTAATPEAARPMTLDDLLGPASPAPDQTAAAPAEPAPDAGPL